MRGRGSRPRPVRLLLVAGLLFAAALTGVLVARADPGGSRDSRGGAVPADPREGVPAPQGPPAALPPPSDLLVPDAAQPGGAALAIGITEPNPSFVWPPRRRRVRAPFGRWRSALARIRPDYYRLVVDWQALQPDPSRPADLTQLQGGCLRTRPPCRAWNGVREQLRALAAAQRGGGWDGVAVVTGTPAWAARAPGGCERPGTEPRSRAPRPEALPAYERLIEDVIELARDEGAALRWWSAWNEPNHPFFLSPQRETCDPAAPSASLPAYEELVNALKAALERAPGEQRQVLGELAAAADRKADVTSVEEFVGGISGGLLCDTAVWAQHAYAGGRSDGVALAVAALDARACPRPHAVWVTETGIRLGARTLPGRLEEGADAVADPLAGCRAVEERLRAWHADPRVTAAFQYTLREDDRFRTGLVALELDRAYPVLDLWEAWGRLGRASSNAPAPASTSCA